MPNVLKKALELLIGAEPSAGIRLTVPTVPPHIDRTHRPFKRFSERELIQLESEIGASLFGEVPKGHRREFFNLDPATWIWYDEWIDKGIGARKSLTIRYEVHENGVLKVQEGARYDFITGQELANFMAAVQLYYERVCRELYQTAPQVPVHHQPRTV